MSSSTFCLACIKYFFGNYDLLKSFDIEAKFELIKKLGKKGKIRKKNIILTGIAGVAVQHSWPGRTYFASVSISKKITNIYVLYPFF